MMQAPSYDTILERCIQLVAKSRKLPPETIAPETSFEALGADSLDMINLSFEVEELFDVQIPDESLSSIHTVEDMARGVSALIAAKTAAPIEKPA
jgi:acyl carrier protein